MTTLKLCIEMAAIKKKRAQLGEKIIKIQFSGEYLFLEGSDVRPTPSSFILKWRGLEKTAGEP